MMQFRLQSHLALRYRTLGAGRTIALLHPIGVHGGFWDPVTTLLARRHRVISIDLRGHGGSDVPGRPFTLDDLAADVVELLRAVGGDRPVVAGCSLGGMVAQGMGLMAPDLAGGYVLAGTNYDLDEGGRGAMAQRAELAAQGMPRIVDTTIPRWFAESFRARDPETVARVRGWLLEADPVVHSWCWSAIRGLAYGERIKAIAAPALVVCGSEDTSCPPAVSKRIAALLPRGRYAEMEGASHVAPLEQPQVFAALVEAFMATDVGAA